MSLKAMSWALDQDCGGDDGLKVLLIAIGDAANDDGVTYKGQVAFGKKLKRSDRTIRARMQKLRETGLLATVERRRGNGSRTSDYTVLAPNWADRGGMIVGEDEELPQAVIDLTFPANHNRQDPSGPVNTGAGSPEANRGVTGSLSSGPDPSGDPSVSSANAEENLSSAGATPLSLVALPEPVMPKRVTYGGQTVPKDRVRMAARLIEVFNRETGRQLGCVTGQGKPSPTLTRVIGGIMMRDSVNEAAWEQAIVHTVANPPGFVEGTLQVGHIFGAQAAEHALANTGVATAKTGSTADALSSMWDAVA